METNYSDDKGMHIMALYEKLAALTNNNHLVKQEANDVANIIFSLIEQMKAKKHTILNRVQHIEARVYSCLGCVACNEGTKESAQEALIHYEKYRDLSISLGLTDEVAEAEKSINIAKAKFGEVMSIKKNVEQSQKLYDIRLKRYGEGAIDTLNCGKNLAWDLFMAAHVVEAEKLLLKLATVSKQVHGSDHSITKKIRSLQRIMSLYRRFMLVFALGVVASIHIIWKLGVVFVSGKAQLYHIVKSLIVLTIILYIGHRSLALHRLLL